MSPLEQSLIAFILAASLLTITPGLDTALVLRTAAAEGPRRAFAAALGIGLGCLAWGALVAVGLGMLLQASELAYLALKWIGAAYLLYLGLRLILARRSEAAAGETAPAPRANWFARGFLTNLLNPKVGAFYVSFLPQFIPAGAGPFTFGVLLTSVHILLGTVWSAFLILLAHQFRAALQRPRARRILDRTTGTVITAFGLRLAATPH